MTETGNGARASGVYGLFRLDGGPVAIADAAKLGMRTSTADVEWLMEGMDIHAPHAVYRDEEADSCLLVVGEIEEPDYLAQRLRLPKGTAAETVAHHAFRHFGADLPAEMIGEWSLLHRHRNGTITLMISAARRDRVFFAIAGRRVAVAPNLLRLSHLPWVSKDVDELVLLSRVGRSNVRSAYGSDTMLSRVKQLEPGTSVTIRPDGTSEVRMADTLPAQPRWQGGLEEALSEAEALMRRIMQQRLARTSRAAPLLSGGLDSSFLAWLIAEERTPANDPLFICSVAPPETGIPDEFAYAQIVADHVGLPVAGIYAEQQVQSYRPSEAIFAGANGPPLSNRYYVTEAFQIAAKAAGADLLINGTYGEMTISMRFFAQTIRQKLRAAASNLVHGKARKTENPFQVRLSHQRLAQMPEPVISLLAKPTAKFSDPRRGETFGYLPGVEKAMQHPNEFYPGALRMDFPFRDVRLLRLFARFPVDMILSEGTDRPIVRKMLANRLPDTIRLRRRGMPASPDHHIRLQRQAAAAQQRIPAFRKADVDEWVDLDWLHDELGSVGTHGIQNIDQANEVQLTAMFAEYLTWWRAQS